MKTNENMEQRLQTLGQSLGQDEALIEAIMTRIEAEPEIPNEKRPPAKGLVRRILMNRYVQLAAASIVVAAVLIAASMLAGSQRKQKPIAQENTNQQTNDAPPQERQLADAARRQKLTAELAQAEAMFAAKDIVGLISILQTGEYETKVAAANYLAQIGDVSAAEALAKLAAEFSDVQPNPFADAASCITERFKREKQQVETVQKKEQEPNEPSAGQTAPPVARTITFRGRVTDSGGKPVDGVMVTSELYFSYMQEDEEYRYAVTDSEGKFELRGVPAYDEQKGTRLLIFDHPDYAIGWWRIEQKCNPENVDVTLYRPAKVAGIVTDRDGNPVSEATVCADIRIAKPNDYFYMSERNNRAVTTDAEGYFAIERVPAGARLNLDASHKNYGRHYTKTEGEGGEYLIRAGDEDVHIALEPGGYITGEFTVDGEPYRKENILVMIFEPEPQFTGYIFSLTDENGRFETKGLWAGTYSVMSGENLTNKELVFDTPTGVKVGTDGIATHIRIAANTGTPVGVTVVDEKTEAPVPQTSVEVFLPEKTALVALTRTDKEGKCTVKLKPGDYMLRVSGVKNGQWHDFEKNFTVAADTDNHVEISINPRPYIYGWLVDPNFKPLEGTVYLDREGPVETGKAGDFVIGAPYSATGEIDAGFAFDKEKTLGKAFLWESTEEPNNIEIVLEPLVTISGRVVDGDGNRPTPKLNLRIATSWRDDEGRLLGRRYIDDGRLCKILLETDGRYEIKGLPTGVEMWIAAGTDSLTGLLRLPELEPGRQYYVNDIVLMPGRRFSQDATRTLSGRIFNERNEPVQGIQVRTYYGKDVTDIKGRYRLTGMPEGEQVEIRFDVEGYGNCSAKTVVDGNDLDVQIFPQGWDLIGVRAPEIVAQSWLNAENVRLGQYRGKVVLLQVGVSLPNHDQQMWQMKELLKKYEDRGLQVIGLHQHLASYEGSDGTARLMLRDAVERYDIKYPFGIDDHPAKVESVGEQREIWGCGATCRLYGTKDAPALFLIDKRGIVRISPTQDNLEEWIKKLLAE